MDYNSFLEWDVVFLSGSRSGYIEILRELLMSMGEGLQLLPSKLRVGTRYTSDFFLWRFVEVK